MTWDLLWLFVCCLRLLSEWSPLHLFVFFWHLNWNHLFGLFCNVSLECLFGLLEDWEGQYLFALFQDYLLIVVTCYWKWCSNCFETTRSVWIVGRLRRTLSFCIVSGLSPDSVDVFLKMVFKLFRDFSAQYLFGFSGDLNPGDLNPNNLFGLFEVRNAHRLLEGLSDYNANYMF